MASVRSLNVFEMDDLFFGSPSPSHWLLRSHSTRRVSDSTVDTQAHREADGPAPGDLFAPADRASTAPSPLGTSAPIDIKWISTGQRRRALQAAKQVSHSFVPPHLLTAQLTTQYLLDQGVSPTACLKKERLKVRDAVLRKTGYQ